MFATVCYIILSAFSSLEFQIYWESVLILVSKFSGLNLVYSDSM